MFSDSEALCSTLLWSLVAATNNNNSSISPKKKLTAASKDPKQRQERLHRTPISDIHFLVLFTCLKTPL